MLKKYILIAGLSFAAAFLVQHIFDEGRTRPVEKKTHSPISNSHQRSESTELAVDDDAVAAILIMPKSYLPVLKRFSQSKMAEHIKILRARILSEGGGITAIYETNTEEKRDRVIMSDNNMPNNMKDAKLARRPAKEKQIIAAGILYLIANAYKNKLY